VSRRRIRSTACFETRQISTRTAPWRSSSQHPLLKTALSLFSFSRALRSERWRKSPTRTLRDARPEANSIAIHREAHGGQHALAMDRLLTTDGEKPDRNGTLSSSSRPQRAPSCLPVLGRGLEPPLRRHRAAHRCRSRRAPSPSAARRIRPAGHQPPVWGSSRIMSARLCFGQALRW